MLFDELDIQHKWQVIAHEIGLEPEDVEEFHTRGGGHGGQKINKSTNCVELTHIPTGVTVRYQHHRGLHQNRKEAWELLIEKVEEHLKGEQSQRQQKQFKIRKQKQRRSRKSKEKMLEEKRQRSEIKETRKDVI